MTPTDVPQCGLVPDSFYTTALIVLLVAIVFVAVLAWAVGVDYGRRLERERRLRPTRFYDQDSDWWGSDETEVMSP